MSGKTPTPFSNRPSSLNNLCQSIRRALYLHRIRIAVFGVLAAAFLMTLLWNSQTAHATTFVSTQSGAWGDPATWGGAGVPSGSDTVTISSGDTVFLETTHNSGDLTINGTLNLNG